MKQHFIKYPVTASTDCDPIYRLHVNMEWDVDGHSLICTDIDRERNIVTILETWISEDTHEEVSEESKYKIVCKDGEEYAVANKYFKLSVGGALNFEKFYPDAFTDYTDSSSATSSDTSDEVFGATSSPSTDVNNYIATLTEGIENLTEDTYQIDQLCEDIQDTVHKLVNKLEYVIADRVYPFDQYEVKAVDETQFYDDFQDNGDLNEAWDKYDEFCRASSEYEADTDYLEKVLDALRSIQTD